MPSDAEILEESARKGDIKSLVITMIMSALGFLVALQWRDAIQETIDAWVPQGEGLFWTYVAALLVTIGAAAAAIILVRLKQANLLPEEKLIGRARRMRHQEAMRQRAKQLEQEAKEGAPA
ncbi:MAG: hypothetical protein HY520_02760 [Candidatus Aenigmarchaeota archaeon]|nr:hypothetical protein [Candidatus Aenigmarchaeota archaeon]